MPEVVDTCTVEWEAECLVWCKIFKKNFWKGGFLREVAFFSLLQNFLMALAAFLCYLQLIFSPFLPLFRHFYLFISKIDKNILSLFKHCTKNQMDDQPEGELSSKSFSLWPSYPFFCVEVLQYILRQNAPLKILIFFDFFDCIIFWYLFLKV